MAIYDTMQLYQVRRVDHLHRHGGLHGRVPAVLAAPRASAIALPNAEIMIHQPSAGTQGKVTDMAIHLERFLKHQAAPEQDPVGEYRQAGREQVTADSERDNCMTAEEAVEYGLIDKVSISTKAILHCRNCNFYRSIEVAYAEL